MSRVNYKGVTSVRFLLLLTFFVGFSQAWGTDVLNVQGGCDRPYEKPKNNINSAVAKRKIAKINIKTGAIFDASEQNLMAIHTLANRMHVNTKKDVIKERLPFKEGDSLDEHDLLEAERIIRSQAYIRDAKITFKRPCNINEPSEIDIQTWDNWSLIPTVSFGRKGGENKLSVGIKEDNLLGSGISARVKYNSDEQRSGYQFTFKSALPLIAYSTVLVDFLDNDDGHRAFLEFDKPFYHLRSKNMFNVSYFSGEETKGIFQNGVTRNRFKVERHRYALSTGWQLSSEDARSTRIKIGYVDASSHFSPVDLLLSIDSLLLPHNRDYQYPWIGIEYLERDFKTLFDIYLINQTEDINLGWHHQVTLGLELNDVDQDSHVGYHVTLLSSKGFEINDGLMLLSIKGKGDINTGSSNVNNEFNPNFNPNFNPDSFLLTGHIEYFKRYTDLIGFYSRVSGTASHNTYLDIPIAIGDSAGVRGYPLQYQHGDHRLTGSVEARFYTGYNILKILDLGLVAFADAGKAWSGDQAKFNETDSILSSVGVGLRLYSSHSSHRSVMHMDISKPFATSTNVDDWEWRLQIKQSF